MALRFSLPRLAQTHHKALILGAGTAGLPMSHRLARHYQVPNLVGLVEPKSDHYYQPLWSLVGAGKKDFKNSVQPLSKLLHKSVALYDKKVEKFLPEENCVVLDNGDKISYDTLVVALGIDLKFGLTKGLEEAFSHGSQNAPGLCTNYSPDICQKTWSDLQTLVEKAKNLPENDQSKKLTVFAIKVN